MRLESIWKLDENVQVEGYFSTLLVLDLVSLYQPYSNNHAVCQNIGHFTAFLGEVLCLFNELRFHSLCTRNLHEDKGRKGHEARYGTEQEHPPLSCGGGTLGSHPPADGID